MTARRSASVAAALDGRAHAVRALARAVQGRALCSVRCTRIAGALAIAGVAAACTLAAGAAFAHGGDEPPPPPYLAGPAIAAADVPPQQPGQTLPLASARRLEFDTDEATWLSPDLSPDGRTIVFDVLGDVYVVPGEGGDARRLTSGLGFDTQPTYSPDGALVAFVSDRSGADNLWVMRADGSEPRQLTFRDDYDPFVTPAWAADGRSLYVTRHRSDINQYELWHVPLDGREPVLAMPVRDAPDAAPDTYRSVSGPFASRDGRHLYYARHVGSLSHDELPEWTIVRRDLRTNADEVLVSAPRSPRPDLSLGTAFRPVVSPDGRLLVYGARRDGRTGLRALDLDTRVDRWLAYPVQQDQLGALASQDLLPRYAFTPDGRAIVLGIDGRLQRIDVATGVATPIPFRVHVSLDVGPALRVPVKEDTGPVRARLVQSPTISPDGRRVAFSALGRLYVMDLRRGAKPRRVTNVADGEFQPSWSSDGRSLVYATWNARDAGHVWTVPATGGAAPTRVTDVAAFYTSPVYAPDGGSIVVLRSSHAVRLHSYMEYGSLRDAELVVLQTGAVAEHVPEPVAQAVAGHVAGHVADPRVANDARIRSARRARVVTRALLGGRPRFARTPNGGTAEVYVNSSSGVDAISLADGTRRRVVSAVGPGWYFAEGLASADLLDVSPDGRWALAQIAQQLHLFAVPGPDAPPVDLTRPAVAHRKLTDVGADFFEWSADGRSIVWSVGSTVHRRALESVQPTVAESPARSREAERFDVRVEVPRDTPRGAIVLRGATAITMRGDERIGAADVVVVDGRIAAIGPRGSVPVPPGARIEDVSGRWLVPGFIDSHDHLADVRRVLLDEESWGPAASLAYGVTTTFDPSSLTIDMFAYGDLVDAGRMLGPRIRTTGPAVFSFNRFESLDEVRAVLTRYVEHYRTRNLKVYRTGNRRVRQWLAQACRELGILPTTEGALSLKLDLTQIVDGFAGSEHSLPAVPLNRDVLELLARMRTSYTLTLQIANGGPAAQDDFVARERPHDDRKLNRFYPHYVLDIRTLNRRWRDPREYLYPRLAASARDVVHAGGLVAMGTHGEMPGLGFHWEMEAHVVGGWTPHEALRAGTLGSAEAIGRHTEFGSLEPGKYADLVVLDRDPLADIRNARAVRFVMKDGRLYAADTLEELWPRRRVVGPRWFTRPGL